MSHPKMCDLMFGSYVVDRAELSSTYGKLDDLLLQLHGNLNEIKTKTVIAPQTIEQSCMAFLLLRTLMHSWSLSCSIRALRTTDESAFRGIA